MIDIRKSVPEYYYNESRDFQLLGRIFEGVLNYYKTATDNIENVPLSNDIDVALLDLVTKTVGFFSKTSFGADNLLMVTNTFKHLLINKGTLGAIESAIKLLLKAQNIEDDFDVIINNEDYEEDDSVYTPVFKREIIIYIPENLDDVSLLESILEYILPFGYNYTIIFGKLLPDYKPVVTVSKDIISISPETPDDILGYVSSGDTTISEDELTNIEDNGEGKGLTDNTVIVKYSIEGE